MHIPETPDLETSVADPELVYTVEELQYLQKSPLVPNLVGFDLSLAPRPSRQREPKHKNSKAQQWQKSRAKRQEPLWDAPSDADDVAPVDGNAMAEFEQWKQSMKRKGQGPEKAVSGSEVAQPTGKDKEPETEPAQRTPPKSKQLDLWDTEIQIPFNSTQRQGTSRFSSIFGPERLNQTLRPLGQPTPPSGRPLGQPTPPPGRPLGQPTPPPFYGPGPAINDGSLPPHMPSMQAFPHMSGPAQMVPGHSMHAAPQKLQRPQPPPGLQQPTTPARPSDEAFFRSLMGNHPPDPRNNHTPNNNSPGPPQQGPPGMQGPPQGPQMQGPQGPMHPGMGYMGMPPYPVYASQMQGPSLGAPPGLSRPRVPGPGVNMPPPGLGFPGSQERPSGERK